jgi:hypothetical protein
MSWRWQRVNRLVNGARCSTARSIQPGASAKVAIISGKLPTKTTTLIQVTWALHRSRTLLNVSPGELEAAIAHIRSGKPPRLTISSTAELFEAVRLGIVDKSEARRLLAFEAKQGRAAAALPRSPRGRFRTSTTA